jgi:hypothetical protein
LQYAPLRYSNANKARVTYKNFGLAAQPKEIGGGEVDQIWESINLYVYSCGSAQAGSDG